MTSITLSRTAIATLTLVAISSFASIVAAPTSYTPTAQLTYEASGPLGKFKGTNKAVTGAFTWDKESNAVKGKICSDQKAWGSGEIIRDNHTRDMFEAEKFTTACFEPSKIEGDPTKGAFALSGNLTMHGVTLPIKIAAQAKTDAGKVTFTGQFPLKLTDYRMEQPSMMGLKVGNDVTVTISAEAATQ
jgi:polyisoprenoid-binding protein YceI